MNIHEYQAKKILTQYGINVPDGAIAYTPAEARRVAQKLSPKGPWILKAQIQSEARSSGHFVRHYAGSKGGVRTVSQIANVTYEAAQMLNNALVTQQTDSAGKLVSKVYVEKYQHTKSLFYAGIIIDGSNSCITLLISDVINENIIKLADFNAKRILQLPLSVNESITDSDVLKILDFLSLDNSYLADFKNFIENLLAAFVKLDAQMIEINPVGVMADKSLIALDAKINFDDKALFRHPDIIRLRDEFEEDARVLKANRIGFHYYDFKQGNIGCIVNGDGLVLEAMDVVKAKKIGLACALNVKGGVDKDKIAEGIKLIMTNPRVEGIFINILGGFLRCNLISDGILDASQDVGLNMPLVVRFEGTNKDAACAILAESRLPVIFADNVDDGINKLLKQMEIND
mgnify:CR=1 FL=1